LKQSTQQEAVDHIPQADLKMKINLNGILSTLSQGHLMIINLNGVLSSINQGHLMIINLNGIS
jgi:hypothetical protein